MALTSKQQAYALAVAEGASSTAAARMAGYACEKSASSLRTQASRLAGDRNVQRAIWEHRERRLSGPMASKALATLEAVMDDLTAPPSARVAAAKWALEAAGFGLENRRLLIRHPEDSNKSLSGMTLAQLEELCRSAETTLKHARGQVIEADADTQTGADTGEED